MTKNSIPYGRQTISQADIDAVIDIMRSDWLTQGPVVERFEKAVAGYCGARYAVAVNSATSALHIACLAAGLGKGDTLWTSPNTFVASANCALYCGAAVDFVDIDPETCNMSVCELEAKLEASRKKGTLPKVVIPVHFAGHSCEMTKIRELSRQYGFAIVEDASHAVGGKYRNLQVGSCTFSEMTVFSFHPVKIITTGEGGMVVTNDRRLYEKLVLLRSHGITRNEAQMNGEPHGPWYYEQIELGFNYRLTEIQAALGESQLRRVDEFVASRNRLAARYDEALRDLPIALPSRQAHIYSAFHLYVIRLRLDRTVKKRREVFEQLRAAGIQVNTHYIPVHTQPYYRKLGFRKGDFPVAENFYEEAITIPLYASLTEKDQDRVIDSIREVLL